METHTRFVIRSSNRCTEQLIKKPKQTVTAVTDSSALPVCFHTNWNKTSFWQEGQINKESLESERLKTWCRLNISHVRITDHQHEARRLSFLSAAPKLQTSHSVKDGFYLLNLLVSWRQTECFSSYMHVVCWLLVWLSDAHLSVSGAVRLSSL